MELIGYVDNAAGLDATFAALADPTRRAILARLASGEASVTELAEPFEMSQPAISKHLKVLERAGLISRGTDAQRRPRKLEAKPLGEATEWLERYREFWEASFERLDTLLSELKGTALKSAAQKDAVIKNSNPKNIGPKNRTSKIKTIKRKTVKPSISKRKHAGPGRQKK
jgi:DNA-binding transcriptional ArsR family regulator